MVGWMSGLGLLSTEKSMSGGTASGPFWLAASSRRSEPMNVLP